MTSFAATPHALRGRNGSASPFRPAAGLSGSSSFTSPGQQQHFNPATPQQQQPSRGPAPRSSFGGSTSLLGGNAAANVPTTSSPLANSGPGTAHAGAGAGTSTALRSSASFSAFNRTRSPLNGSGSNASAVQRASASPSPWQASAGSAAKTNGSAGKSTPGSTIKTATLASAGSGLLNPIAPTAGVAGRSHSDLVKILMTARLKRIYALAFLSHHLLFAAVLSMLHTASPSSWASSLSLLGAPFAPLRHPLRFATFGYVLGADGEQHETPSLLGPTTLLFSCASFALGTLPLLVAAKWRVSGGGVVKRAAAVAATPAAAAVKAITPSPPSPQDPSIFPRHSPGAYALRALRAGRAAAPLSALLSGLCAALWAFCAWVCLASFDVLPTASAKGSDAEYQSGGNPWDLRIQVPKRPPGTLRPNEHVLYLLASTAAFGALFSAWTSLRAAADARAAASDAQAPPAFSPAGAKANASGSSSGSVGMGAQTTTLWDARFSPDAIERSLSARLQEALFGHAPDAASFAMNAGVPVARTPSGLLLTTLGQSLTLTGLQFSGYMLVRRSLFAFALQLIGLRSPLRALLLPSFRHAFFTPTYIASVAALHAAMALTWAIAAALWRTYATHPPPATGGLSIYAKDPTRCLVQGLLGPAGLTSTSGSRKEEPADYYAHFAFAELCALARGDAGRRKAIFRDLTNNTAGGATGTIRPLLSSSTRPLLAAKDNAGAASDVGNSSSNALGLTATSTTIGSSPSASASGILASPVGTPRRAAQLAGSNTGNAWTLIVGQCLAVLERQKQWAAKRGALPAVSAKPASSANRSSSAGADRSPKLRNMLQQSDAPIVQTPKLTVWDRLAADAQQSAPSTPKPQSSTSQPASSTATHAKDIWHKLAPSGGPASAIAAQAVQGTQQAAAKTQQAVPRVQSLTVTGLAQAGVKAVQSVWAALPAAQRKRVLSTPGLRALPGLLVYTFTPSPALIARHEVLYEDAALLTWAAGALGALATASLQEDEYGLVQKDLPAILVCCAETFSAVERWGDALRSQAQELDAQYKAKADGEQKEAQTQSDPQQDSEEGKLLAQWHVGVEPSLLALRDAVNGIVTAFEGYSLDLKQHEWELVRGVLAPAGVADPVHKPEAQQSDKGPEMRQISSS